MIEQLVEKYRNGSITAHHLAVESLHMLDAENPSLVLQFLPKSVLEQMSDYVREFRPGQMRTNYGLQPAVDQVDAARQWLEAKARQSA